MRYEDFEKLVERLATEVPPEFLDGVIEVAVSPKSVPHPTRSDIYTLGECIPESLGEGVAADPLQSRVVLYHGSFAALAKGNSGFDWNAEAWETLTHELRHHLEWRARSDDLEQFDAAAEHNFARRERDDFDPLFFLDGDEVEPGLYQVDDDYFIDRVVREVPKAIRFGWHGREYEAELPQGLELPALLEVAGLDEPPPGSLLLSLRRRPSLLSLFRPGDVHQGMVRARPTRVS